MATEKRTTVTTSGGTVRITQPAAAVRGRKRSTAAVVVDVVTPKAVDGFFNFLREHAVVGLAVGLVIGTQIKAIVDALNASIIDPLFTLVFGGQPLNNRGFYLHFNGHASNFTWGKVAYQIIDFVFVMAVLYIIIKLFKLDKLDQPKT